MKTRRKKSFFLIVLLFSVQFGIAGNIINTADYPYWRALADSIPMFSDMKASSLSIAIQSGETRDVMGGNALAYILDPDNKTNYLANIKEKFDTRITDMTIGTGAATSSVPSHELFYALLALDVIRYDLDSATLGRYESLLEEKIMKLVIGKWDPHGWAMRMLWYKYIGEEENFQKAKVEWEIGLSEHYMPDDGVSPAGNGYCVQRWNSIERAAKNTSADLMEYMGYNEYYTNPGIVGLHEFMYGYAVSPFGRILIYGDSRSTEGQRAWDIERGGVILSPTIVSTARFSTKAYKYAMWVLREGAGFSDAVIKGHLSNYLVMAGSAAKNNPIVFDVKDAELAPSRLFENYAALISNEQSANALYMSMMNLTGNTEYHTHYEANALAMAGYGETLLRNAGYTGPNRDVTVDGVTATFNFMHSDSESANTLMIGDEKHSSKTGDGIVEGWIGQDIEYFRGASSDAIAGTHYRDGIFLQPSNGVNGYYVVMDHVSTNNSGDNVNIVWHPNAASLNTIQKETKYLSEIKIESGDNGPKLYSENKVSLTTLLGTAPVSVEIKRTANQASLHSYAADYLYANYNTVDKKAAILTVLFPGDKTHEVGEMTRIVSGDYTGAKIVQNDIQDVALASNGFSMGTYGAETFQGENIIYRKSSNEFISYFVKGISFDDGQNVRCGFQAEDPVALYMYASIKINGMRGTVISDGTSLTFYCPEIESVQLDGKAVELIDSGLNWAKVQVPSGEFLVDIVTNLDH